LARRGGVGARGGRHRVRNRCRDLEACPGGVPRAPRPGTAHRLRPGADQDLEEARGARADALPRLARGRADVRAPRLHRPSHALGPRGGVLTAEELEVVLFTLRIAAAGTLLLLPLGIAVAFGLARYRG